MPATYEDYRDHVRVYETQVKSIERLRTLGITSSPDLVVLYRKALESARQAHSVIMAALGGGKTPKTTWTDRLVPTALNAAAFWNDRVTAYDTLLKNLPGAVSQQSRLLSTEQERAGLLELIAAEGSSLVEGLDHLRRWANSVVDELDAGVSPLPKNTSFPTVDRYNTLVECLRLLETVGGG